MTLRRPVVRPPSSSSALTVGQWFDAWRIRQQAKRGWPAVGSRFAHHILPAIGHMVLADVRPSHLRQMVDDLQDKGLAPRTVRACYGHARSMLRGAQKYERIAVSPAILDHDDLPDNEDQDPTWRLTAIFSRAEVGQLLSDERIPQDRRVLIALQALGGMRISEATGLRWKDWEGGLEPLGRLTLLRTKTGKPRAVPAHPVLAAMLAEWKMGYHSRLGRFPSPESLICPRLDGRRQTADGAKYYFDKDLVALGLRARRQHDLRASMITYSREDGAEQATLKQITHGCLTSILDVYTRWPWPMLCAEVGKLKLRRRSGELAVATIAEGG